MIHGLDGGHRAQFGQLWSIRPPFFIQHDEFRSTAAGGGKAPRSGVVGGDRREPPVSYNDIRRPRRGQRTQDMYIVKDVVKHMYIIPRL